MRYFQDTVLLLLYGLFSLSCADMDILLILAFLCALILCSGNYCTEVKNVRLALCILYLVPAWFCPPFFFFYPLAVYLLLRIHSLPFSLLAVLLYLYHCYAAGSVFLFFFGLFGFLLAYLLQMHTEQYGRLESNYRQTQDDSRERNFLLSEKNKSLLEKQNYEIYAATLKERNRIAREIHDNVGHMLSRSILLLGAVKAVNRQDNLNPMLENLDGSLNAAMNSIRSSVHDLHDESINLEDAIHALIDEFRFCPVEFQYDMEPGIAKEIKYSFISITKEALSNVMKHSNATQVSITMREHPALYQLRIADNGTPAKHSGSGIGLINMKDRVQALQGTFLTTEEDGFQIFITIPKGE